MADTKIEPYVREEEKPSEPGYGLAMLTVLVMLLVVGVLSALIYVLMVAISPIESRKGKAEPTVVVPATPAPAYNPPQTAK